MFSLVRSMGLVRLCLSAVLMACLAPVASAADSIRFRNETNGPVILQTSSVIQGVVRQGPRFLLNPNDMTPPIVLPGNKIITMNDPRMPTRILYQGTVPAGNEEQSFGIVSDNPAPRVKIEARRPARP